MTTHIQKVFNNFSDVKDEYFNLEKIQYSFEERYSKYTLKSFLKNTYEQLVENIEETEYKNILVIILSNIFIYKKLKPEIFINILHSYQFTYSFIIDALTYSINNYFIDWDGSYIHLRYDLNENIKNKLEKFQYPYPMVIKPNKLFNNKNTAYCLTNIPVKINLNQENINNDYCLDVLNIQNSIPLKTNPIVFNFIKDNYFLSKPKKKETDTLKDYQNKEKQFYKFYNNSIEVIKELLIYKKYYLTHKYDERGRVYVNGYHINTQGSTTHKSLTELANKTKIINEKNKENNLYFYSDVLKPIDYIKSEILNFIDKKFEKFNWVDKIDYFDKNENQLLAVKNYKDLNNPFGFISAIDAYNKAKCGEKIGYLISLDATASGIQLLSILSKCKKSFKYAGGNSNKCSNTYLDIYNKLNFNQNKYNFDVIKKTIMTSFYGSYASPLKVFGENVNKFFDFLDDELPGAWKLQKLLENLWHQFPEPTYSWILPDNFHASITVYENKVSTVNFNNTVLTVHSKEKYKAKFHKGLAPNFIHSIDAFIAREMIRRSRISLVQKKNIINALKNPSYKEKNDKKTKLLKILLNNYKTNNILSTRILSCITKHNSHLIENKNIIKKLIRELPAKPFQLICIHDNFKCHPNYGNDVRQQYNYILADILDSTILNSFIFQILKKSKYIEYCKSKNLLNRKDILTTNYTLT